MWPFETRNAPEPSQTKLGGFDHRFGHQAHQTEKCGTEKWQILSFCPTFFCLMAETMINANLDKPITFRIEGREIGHR